MERETPVVKSRGGRSEEKKEGSCHATDGDPAEVNTNLQSREGAYAGGGSHEI